MGTLANKSEVHREMQQTFGRIPEWAQGMPEEALSGFWTIMRDLQLGETRIPNKYKELIGLAVSGATRCRYCTLFHTEAARLNGATDEEIAEASMMGGFTMMASTYLNAQQVDYSKFQKEMADIVTYLKQSAASQGATKGKPAHA